MAEQILVGEWHFSPQMSALSRGGERRRLEHRAAMVLELLCRRQGTPVSAAELVAAVWNGRALSQNSVAVVIADLRRALGDDSRQPRYIETIPKRGYRLVASVSEAPTVSMAARPVRRIGIVVAVLVLAFMAGGALLFANRARAPFTVEVVAVPNETRDSAYDPLAMAVTELIGTELGRLPNVRVMRGARRVNAQIRGTLILWNGQAALAMSAEDPGSGSVLWSGMASGPAGLLPAQVRSEMGEFRAYVDNAGHGSR
jgi:DNA-binding winged helix-turn-helix (wHTH) protein